MKEIWKEVPFAPSYQVSNRGRVKHLEHLRRHRRIGHFSRIKERILKQRVHSHGYTRVQINYKDYYTHRLVAEFFIGIPIGKEVNHINSIKSDNRLENLEVVTRSQNVRHSYDFGNGYAGQRKRVPKISGSNNYWAKFNEAQVKDMRLMKKRGVARRDIEKKYKAKQGFIDGILNGSSWKHVKI